MSTRWLEVELEVPTAVADDFAAGLFEVGADGVQLIDVAQIEEALPNAPPPRVPANADHTLLVVTFEEAPPLEEALLAVSAVAEALETTVAPGTLGGRYRDDTGWADAWKQYFEPLQIGRGLWIVPTWRPEFVPPEGALVLRMDPGMAFGTGQHATTSGCLELLVDDTMARGAARVLDVGCGSGVLGIVCAQLGSSEVLGIDIDQAAVDATLENAALNGVADRVQSSTTPLDDVTGTYDIVLANILAHTLTAMADTLLARVAPGGVLMLSGILLEQVADLRTHFEARAAAAQRSLEVCGERARGDWTAFAWRVS